MKRGAERETDDRGQKQLIKCCRLGMSSCRWEPIDPGVFLKRSCVLRGDKHWLL